MQNFKAALGTKVHYDFCPPSEIVGIDHYTMKAFNGAVQKWDSYTLTSDADGAFSRWWIVNVVGRGAHSYVAATDIPENLPLAKELSGLVALDSEGNADLSSGKGALATYAGPDGTLYAEEVFDGADRLLFIGKPFTP